MDGQIWQIQGNSPGFSLEIWQHDSLKEAEEISGSQAYLKSSAIAPIVKPTEVIKMSKKLLINNVFQAF